jgi:hypothetical protein
MFIACLYDLTLATSFFVKNQSAASNEVTYDQTQHPGMGWGTWWTVGFAFVPLLCLHLDYFVHLLNRWLHDGLWTWLCTWTCLVCHICDSCGIYVICVWYICDLMWDIGDICDVCLICVNGMKKSRKKALDTRFAMCHTQQSTPGNRFCHVLVPKHTTKVPPVSPGNLLWRVPCNNTRQSHIIYRVPCMGHTAKPGDFVVCPAWGTWQIKKLRGKYNRRKRKNYSVTVILTSMCRPFPI